jgi:hypothetical protein
VLAAIVTVDGGTTCPTPAQVTDQVELLLADRSGRSAPDQAHLASNGDVIELELASASGRSLVRREFGRAASCEQLAAAIAVVIATSELGDPGLEPTISVEARQPSYPRSVRLAVATGGVAMLDRGGWAPGASAELAVGPTLSRWSGVVDAIVTTPNSASLSPGSASWVRERFAIGARVEVVARGAFLVEASGQFVAGLLIASGKGFSMDRTSPGFDPGVELGIRGAFRRDAWTLFASASETGWLRADHLEVTGLSRVDAPRHDLVISLGIGWQLVGP